MVFDYVVIRTEEAEGKSKEVIVKEGRVVAKNRDNALLKIGCRLEPNVLEDDVEVSLRSF